LSFALRALNGHRRIEHSVLNAQIAEGFHAWINSIRACRNGGRGSREEGLVLVPPVAPERSNSELRLAERI
jgi:hypothetical protein